MQIIGLHKNVYKFYAWARTQECLDAYRLKYEGSVRHWEALRAEGVSVAKCAEFVGMSRATYYRHKRVLRDLAQSILPPSKAPIHRNKSRWGEAEKQLVLEARRDNETYGKEKIGAILRRDKKQTMSDSTVGRILGFLSMKGLITRELAVKYTDEKRYFVSESSAYRILKAADLITALDYVVIKTADEFKDKTTAINEMWQTDFTYFKIIGWGWYYLSTILDDYSRYIIAWKLCTTMQASDVTETLELALAASGCDQAVVCHKPRLLSDNGSCYISGDLAEWLEGQKMKHVRGALFHPQTQGKIERWHQTMKNRVLLETITCPETSNVRSGPLWSTIRPALPREPEQRHAR